MLELQRINFHSSSRGRVSFWVVAVVATSLALCSRLRDYYHTPPALQYESEFQSARLLSAAELVTQTQQALVIIVGKYRGGFKTHHRFVDMFLRPS